MQKLCWLVFFITSISVLSAQNRYRINLPLCKAQNVEPVFSIFSEKPECLSPAITETGRELVLIKTKNGNYAWFDGTIENGEAFDYKKRLYGKGNQLLADKTDFPHLAKTGVHSNEDLRNAKLITGRSVAQITVDARPWGSSGVGFVADDETIISVIFGDNETVKSLDLTHPDIARPLFHFWNVARDFEKLGENQAKAMIYKGHEVEFKIQGSRGWQESIFNDEILGTGHIELWRKLTEKELTFLHENYNHLASDQFESLKKELSYIHTGAMVPFYINRYGFYEGHNEYRIDPVSVAIVFGLRSVEEVHRAVGGDLYHYFTSHFTFNPE